MPPGLLMAWGTNLLFIPTSPTATELTSLEVFIEKTWDGVFEQDS